MQIKFQGEIKSFGATKTASNDKVRRLVIVTDEKETNSLIGFEVDKLYTITISEDE